MKQIFWLVAFSGAILAAAAQENSALLEMVKAEKSFAADASSIGIQQAFLKYFDDSALVFEGGQIRNGREVWKDRNTEGASLIWYPEFAEVSASGDFGYTTGPSQFRIRKEQELPDHRGQFSSIWKKNKDGVWKVMLDIGIPSADSVYDESLVQYDTQRSDRKAKKSVNDDLKRIEETFIRDYNAGNAYIRYGSKTGRGYRPRQKFSKGNFPVRDSVGLQFRNAGTAMSSSGDLGYAYGYVTASGAAGNYLRVWKKEQGQWKIVLDVANY